MSPFASPGWRLQASLFLGVPAGASGQYEMDPLGLVTGPGLTSCHSLCRDNWEVWVSGRVP